MRQQGPRTADLLGPQSLRSGLRRPSQKQSQNRHEVVIVPGSLFTCTAAGWQSCRSESRVKAPVLHSVVLEMELPGQQAQEGSPSGFGHSVPGPLSSSHVALLTCQGSHRLSPLRFKWGGQCQLHSEDTLQPSAAFRLAATPPYSWALVFRRQQVCPMGSHGKPLSSLSRWFLYAIHGFFSEVMFTASWDFIQTQDWTLRGVASVWVLFIYGTGILGLEQLHRGLDGRWPLLARGCLYTACIYLWEFFTGALLRRFGACPWDYSHFRYNVMGLVTLEYSPFWFLGSLLLERLVIRNILRLRLDRAPQPRGQPHARLAWKDD